MGSDQTLKALRAWSSEGRQQCSGATSTQWAWIISVLPIVSGKGAPMLNDFRLTLIGTAAGGIAGGGVGAFRANRAGKSGKEFWMTTTRGAAAGAVVGALAGFAGDKYQTRGLSLDDATQLYASDRILKDDVGRRTVLLRRTSPGTPIVTEAFTVPSRQIVDVTGAGATDFFWPTHMYDNYRAGGSVYPRIDTDAAPTGKVAHLLREGLPPVRLRAVVDNQVTAKGSRLILPLGKPLTP